MPEEEPLEVPPLVVPPLVVPPLVVPRLEELPEVPPEPDEPEDMLLPPELLPLEPVPPWSPRWQPMRNALRIATPNINFEVCFIVFPFNKWLHNVLSRL